MVRPRTGVVLAKLCDQVHAGRYQWQVFAFVQTAQERGWTACQPLVVRNSGRGRDPKHHAKYHSRNGGAVWIVLRHGAACHGPGRRLKHELVCQSCGGLFWARRSDARTCSKGCRDRLYRRQQSTRTSRH